MNQGADQKTPASDVSYVHEKGRFYLAIDSFNAKWTVTVEDELPQGVEPVANVLSTTFTTIKQWSGSATKDTESFTINSNYWRISWNVKGDGAFQIFIYDQDNEQVGLVGDIRSGSGFSYVYSPAGEYHLGIDSSNVEYSLVVEQPV